MLQALEGYCTCTKSYHQETIRSNSGFSVEGFESGQRSLPKPKFIQVGSNNSRQQCKQQHATLNERMFRLGEDR